MKKISPSNYASCPSHCCPVHGCKYGYEECPVSVKSVPPEYPNNNGCEYCEFDREQVKEMDVASLDAAALSELKAKISQLERDEDRRVRAAIPTMSVGDLRRLKKRIEDRDGECDDGWQPEEHLANDCVACAARDELAARDYRERSKEPGKDPAIYIPGVQTVTFSSRLAKELLAGDTARHRPNPGSLHVFYVEVVKVVVESKHVHVWWRKTNTFEQKPFKTTYALTENVEVSRVNHIKKGS